MEQTKIQLSTLLTRIPAQFRSFVTLTRAFARPLVRTAVTAEEREERQSGTAGITPVPAATTPLSCALPLTRPKRLFPRSFTAASTALTMQTEPSIMLRCAITVCRKSTAARKMGKNRNSPTLMTSILPATVYHCSKSCALPTATGWRLMAG